MNRRILVGLVLVTSSLVIGADLKPGQEEAKIKFDKQAADLVNDVNAACGTNFKEIASDFENYDKADFNRNPPGSICSMITYAAKTTCASAPYKKAFASKIKGIACVMGGNKTDPKDVKARVFVKDGVLTYKMDRDGAGGIEATAIIKAELDK